MSLRQTRRPAFSTLPDPQHRIPRALALLLRFVICVAICGLTPQPSPGWDPDKGPQYLEAFTRSGLVLAYGQAPSGQVLAKNGVIRAWWVTQATDRRGNGIAYTYRNDKDPDDGYTVEHAPLRIDYTTRSRTAYGFLRSERLVRSVRLVPQRLKAPVREP
jgi:hypothetical protein